jgi:hypothetical protein
MYGTLTATFAEHVFDSVVSPEAQTEIEELVKQLNQAARQFDRSTTFEMRKALLTMGRLYRNLP